MNPTNTDVSLKSIFEDKDLPKTVLEAYRKGNPSKTYTLEMCQRSVMEFYRACTIEARAARSYGNVGLYDVDPILIRGAMLDIATEGLSLLPQSRHFFLSVLIPDFATQPVLEVVLRKRGIQHLIYGHENYEDFTMQLVHKGDLFAWKGQSTEPVYESNPDNMRNPIVCAWCMYKELGKPARYYLIDGEPIELKAAERRECDPSMNNPWVRFPRITKESEVLRACFSMLNPIHNFTLDSSSDEPKVAIDIHPASSHQALDSSLH